MWKMSIDSIFIDTSIHINMEVENEVRDHCGGSGQVPVGIQGDPIAALIHTYILQDHATAAMNLQNG